MHDVVAQGWGGLGTEQEIAIRTGPRRMHEMLSKAGAACKANQP